MSFIIDSSIVEETLMHWLVHAYRTQFDLDTTQHASEVPSSMSLDICTSTWIPLHFFARNPHCILKK